MNQKSLKDLKHLTSEIVNNPKLINKLDEIRIRYAEITEKLEDPETYKDHKLLEKLNKETLEPIINSLIKSNETNFKGVGQPLRIIFTGSKFGPGIYDIINSLGKNEVLKRLGNKIT